MASDNGINIVSDYRSGEICGALFQLRELAGTICNDSDFLTWVASFRTEAMTKGPRGETMMLWHLARWDERLF